MKRLVFYFAFFALIIFVLSPLAIAHASPPPAGHTHLSAPSDSDPWAHPHPAAKQRAAADLNVGEPRTVRIIYFLPNDRPYSPKAVTRMKEDIRKAQTFFAEQMQAHGYGNKTFRIETDAQGEPLVHRVDGQYPANHYLLKGALQRLHFEEFEHSIFDTNENIYVVYISLSVENRDNTGNRNSKRGGWVNMPFTEYNASYWEILAHELGHAFGWGHDFRSDRYIMSYGSPDVTRDRLSPCSAEFLSVHPYFNPATPLEDASPSRIRLLSPTQYPPGSTRVPVQLKLSHSDELHQVILSNHVDLVTCLGLDGKEESVTLDYEGVFTTSGFSSLPSSTVHRLNITSVDAKGNMTQREFRYGEVSPHLMATLKDPSDGTNDLSFQVLFSPDGTTLASAGNQLTLWNAATQTKIATLDRHEWGVQSVSFSPDGATLASTGPYDKIVRLQDIATPTKKAYLRHKSVVRSVLFSPDGTTLATGNAGEITLWDVATQQATTLKAHSDPSINWVDLLSFSPDGSLLASASLTNTVILWDVATQTKIKTFPNDYLITGLSFSSDGNILAVGLLSGAVLLWDLSGQIQRLGTCQQTGGVGSVSFSPTLGIMASGGTGGEILLWNAYTQKSIAAFPHRAPIGSVSFSPTLGIMASRGIDDSQILLWDVSEWIGTTAPEPLPATDVSGFFRAPPTTDQPSLLTAHVPHRATEAKLRRGEVTVALFLSDFITFEPSIESIPDAVTVSGIPGVTIVTVWRRNDREILLETRFSGNIDHDTPLTFTVAAAAIADYSGPPLTAQIPVTATEEIIFTGPLSIITTPVPLTEAGLHGSTATLILDGLTYEQDIADKVTVSGIPGVTTGIIFRANDAQLVVKLNFSGDINSDAQLTFTVAAAAIADYSGPPLTAQIPVTATQENTSGENEDEETSGENEDDEEQASSDDEDLSSLFDAFGGKQVALPDSPQLAQNAPNPFNSQTVLTYFLPAAGSVRLAVFTLTGQRVAILQHGPQPAGYHRLRWNGHDDDGRPVASGLYLYRLMTDETVLTRKLILLR